MFKIQIENKKLPTPNLSGQDCWIMYNENIQFGLSDYNIWTVEGYHRFNTGDSYVERSTI